MAVKPVSSASTLVSFDPSQERKEPAAMESFQINDCFPQLRVQSQAALCKADGKIRAELDRALEQGAVDTVKRILTTHDYLLEVRDDKGRTPNHDSRELWA